MDGEVIEVRVKDPSIEDVNRHLLNKLDDLIESVDAKTNPELVRVITESVAKLNTSLKGNDIFAPRETETQKKEREAAEVLAATLKGE